MSAPIPNASTRQLAIPSGLLPNPEKLFDTIVFGVQQPKPFIHDLLKVVWHNSKDQQKIARRRGRPGSRSDLWVLFFSLEVD
jgi:hypothetical protein